MHDSFTAIGGLVPMLLMQLGEVVFGGVGSGLYGMLVYAVLAVFIAGLMIGRTPEYLGKKIEAYEMKMTAVAILVTPLLVLVGTAIAVMLEPVAPACSIRARTVSPRSCTRCRRRRTTTAARLPAFPPTHPSTTRFWLRPCGSGVSGSSCRCWRWPVRWPPSAVRRSAGTMPTHGPLFIVLLVGSVLLVGALTYVPALALGPVAEQLQPAAVTAAAK
jgi:K+-transporting ATPase ATPase A chain